jgi:hypothetical protein
MVEYKQIFFKKNMITYVQKSMLKPQNFKKEAMSN